MKNRDFITGYMAGYMDKQAQEPPEAVKQEAIKQYMAGPETSDENLVMHSLQTPGSKIAFASLGALLAGGIGAGTGAIIAGKGKRKKGALIGLGAGAVLGGLGGYAGPAAAARGAHEAIINAGGPEWMRNAHKAKDLKLYGKQ